MKLKVTKGELIISNGLEMADDYLPGGVGATPPALVRVKPLFFHQNKSLGIKWGETGEELEINFFMGHIGTEGKNPY